MYNNEDMNWFSQTLLTHNDKTYATDGYIRVSLSTGTKDFVNFNPLQFGITISNSHSKNCNLNIQNASDLLRSFGQIIQEPDKVYRDNDFQIVKRYNKNLEIVFEFLTVEGTNEKVVRITFRSNESDFTKIIITFNLFVIFARRLKAFVDNYDHFSISIPNNFIQKELLNVNKIMLSTLSSLPSSIAAAPNTGAVSEEVPIEEVQKAEATIEELDTFMSNQDIEVPEIEIVETKKEVIQEVSSILLKCMDNDLSNFENLLTTAESSNEPINFIIDKLFKDKNMMNGNSDEFEALPNISEDDMKSLLYISKINYNVSLKNCIEFGNPVPSSIPILKYKPNVDVAQLNIEIAYDMLLFNGFFRCLRRKLEDKVDDAMVNKSLTYLLLRCYTDPFVFSFIENVDPAVLKSAIMSRFLYYNSIGIFGQYINLLETYNTTPIASNDISFFIDEVVEKVLGKTSFINEFHNELSNRGMLRLPSKNTLNKEQIINELIPLEISEALGNKITNDKITELLPDGISDEVKDLYKKEKVIKKQTKSVKKKSSTLYKLVKQFRNEIPENKREQFLKLIDALGNDEYVSESKTFPLEEMGENIVKALYIWKPKDDPKLTSNFKYLFEKFEEEIMTKELIMADLNPTESKSTGDDWSAFM